jgi:hypothetical protein
MWIRSGGVGWGGGREWITSGIEEGKMGIRDGRGMEWNEMDDIKKFGLMAGGCGFSRTVLLSPFLFVNPSFNPPSSLSPSITPSCRPFLLPPIRGISFKFFNRNDILGALSRIKEELNFAF